ncbi:hypothetical protein PMIN04_006789 [Paraphaeosphaeria minitans]
MSCVLGSLSKKKPGLEPSPDVKSSKPPCQKQQQANFPHVAESTPASSNREATARPEDRVPPTTRTIRVPKAKSQKPHPATPPQKMQNSGVDLFRGKSSTWLAMMYVCVGRGKGGVGMEQDVSMVQVD